MIQPGIGSTVGEGSGAVAVVGWLDRAQRRHPALGFPLAVIYKFFDDQGVYLAALIAFYAFISLFPLFLLLSAILGFALENDPGLRDAILDSAAGQIPVIGQQIETRQLSGSGTAVTVGIVTALYGSLGVAQAIQNAMNVVWSIRRNERPNPILSRLRSLGLLSILGLFVVATTLLSQLGSALRATDDALSGDSEALAALGSLILSATFFIIICRLGTATNLAVGELLPGAVLAALAWQGLQTTGGTFISSVVARSSTTNSVFAIVLGLLAWLFFASIALVMCLEVNVVHARQLYPRSLLTPMTDLVDLTDADRAAYARLVRAQALKGFQNVDVTFEHDGQNASAQRAARAQARGEESSSASPARSARTAATRILRPRGGATRARGQADPGGDTEPGETAGDGSPAGEGGLATASPDSPGGDRAR